MTYDYSASQFDKSQSMETLGPEIFVSFLKKSSRNTHIPFSSSISSSSLDSFSSLAKPPLHTPIHLNHSSSIASPKILSKLTSNKRHPLILSNCKHASRIPREMHTQLDVAFPSIQEPQMQKVKVEQELVLEKQRTQDLIVTVLNEDVAMEEYEWKWHEICRGDGSYGVLIDEIWDEVSESVLKEIKKPSNFK
jgi:hypothetical protein